MTGQAGGSVDVLGVTVGGDYQTFTDPLSGKNHSGLSANVGIGINAFGPIPLEIHGDIAYAKVFSINVFEEWDKAYSTIIRW